MGHSSRCGGCLNKASSCISAIRLSHFFLCFDLCFFLHAALQYVTILHLLQELRLLPSLPQLAHFDKVGSLLPSVLILLVLILLSGVFMWCPIFTQDRRYEERERSWEDGTHVFRRADISTFRLKGVFCTFLCREPEFV